MFSVKLAEIWILKYNDFDNGGEDCYVGNISKTRDITFWKDIKYAYIFRDVDKAGEWAEIIYKNTGVYVCLQECSLVEKKWCHE